MTDLYVESNYGFSTITLIFNIKISYIIFLLNLFWKFSEAQYYFVFRFLRKIIELSPRKWYYF